MNNIDEFINEFEYTPKQTEQGEQKNGDNINNTEIKKNVTSVTNVTLQKNFSECNATNSESVTTLQNENVTQCNACNATKKYSSFSFADCCRTPTPIKWTIKGYIPEQSLCMTFGASGSGKSFIVYDMAGAIASPEIETWQGRKLKHGHVIIFAGEGAAGVRQRFAGWAAKRNINPENVKLTVIDEAFHLDSEIEDYSIENTIANIREYSNEPALIVFDTLNRYMSGDENKAVDTGRMLEAYNKIIKELKCSIMIIHHTGNSEDAKNRARGSSAWKGALDIELQVTKDDKRITLKQTKNKDAELEKPIVFNLEKMIIPEWFDEDGEAVTTCTIEINEILTQITAMQKKEDKKPPQSELTAKETYSKAAQKTGSIMKDIDNETGQEIEFVALEVEDWRKTFYENSSADKDATKRQQFDRARKLLLEVKHALFKRTIQGHDYYCLIPTGDTYEATIKSSIQKREQEAPDTTGNLFS